MSCLPAEPEHQTEEEGATRSPPADADRMLRSGLALAGAAARRAGAGGAGAPGTPALPLRRPLAAAAAAAGSPGAARPARGGARGGGGGGASGASRAEGEAGEGAGVEVVNEEGGHLPLGDDVGGLAWPPPSAAVQAALRHQEVAGAHPDGTANTPGTCVRAPGRLSIQEAYEPRGVSFGSGLANPIGLQLRSYRPEGPLVAGTLEAEWEAGEEHQGIPGVVAGGILGAIVENQGNWSAAVALMDNFDLRAPPLTVTSSYRVDLLKPAPVGQPLAVRCEVQYCTDVDVEVEVTISTRSPVHEGAEITCAIGQGSFKKIGPLRSFDAIL